MSDVMAAVLDLGDDTVETTPRRLNGPELLAHQHARRSAVRALAGLARNRDDFQLLADMIGLDPADSRLGLEPLVITPALPPPPPERDKPDLRPVGLRFTATERQQTTRPVRAAKPKTPTKGEVPDRLTVHGEVSRQAAATKAHDGATGHDGGPTRRETTPASREGGRGEQPAPVAPAAHKMPAQVTRPIDYDVLILTGLASLVFRLADDTSRPDFVRHAALDVATALTRLQRAADDHRVGASEPVTKADTVRRPGTKAKPIDEDLCLHLYVEQNLSVNQLARRLGAHTSRISAVLRDRGVLRPHGSRGPITKASA